MNFELTPWQAALSDEEQVEVLGLVKRSTIADGVAPFSGHILDAFDRDSGSESDAYLLAFSEEELAGIAVLHAGDPAEVAVDPLYRRCGLGSSLLAAVLVAQPDVWAHGDLVAASELASKLSLTPTRELLQLRRPAAPVADAVWPQGVSVRTFVVGQDEEAFLGVNARAFSWHPEQGRLDLAGLQAEQAEPWFDPAGFFLAVDESDRILGFHWTKVHGVDPTPGTGPVRSVGEVYVLAVDPESPVRGLGTPLTLAGLAYLERKNLHCTSLYVEGNNDKAIHLYEKLGFQRYLRDVVYSRV
ncbi:mycothiol synthase [Nakamurella antarctica]|uniref:Mycothiol acetyltransferase n=1 Tax=Nakamurella antarctica TaxID=1902245 RepID=A0A3G8ZP57_9ACTN|nr:mycothiol synthase [Nakamurella antarctica]AZI59043.1 mycothiol synthase [Nakamurella antarctica]